MLTIVDFLGASLEGRAAIGENSTVSSENCVCVYRDYFSNFYLIVLVWRLWSELLLLLI